MRMMMLSVSLLLLQAFLMCLGQDTSQLHYRGLACEGDTLVMHCPLNYRLQISEAFFGRDDSTTCLDSTENSDLRCEAEDALDKVMEECHGHQRCEMEASFTISGNGCRMRGGVNKYMKVNFTCEPKIHKALLCEGGWSLEIGCPRDHYIAPVSAMFGRKDTTTCPHADASTTNTNCSSSLALPIFENLCSGKSSCITEASNSLFGDPCSDTYKYLSLEYSCEACVNNHSDAECERYAMDGECQTNPKWMIPNCRKACWNCKSTPKTCINIHDDNDCETWKQDGECEKNPSFMFPFCYKSCHCQRGIEIEYKGLATISKAMCDGYARNNQCRDNPGYMLAYCMPSCYPLAWNNSASFYFWTGSSYDATQCQSWADDGECTKNPAYMLVYCPTVCWSWTAQKFNYLPCENYFSSADANTDVDAQCEEWFWDGECFKNPEFMYWSCPKSCFRCTGARNCTNHANDASCETWAHHGECSKNPYFMLGECYKSCTKCGGSTAPPECENTYPDNDCDRWANLGDCVNANYTVWMHSNCHKSCSRCDLYNNARLGAVGSPAVPGQILETSAHWTMILNGTTTFTSLGDNTGLLTHFTAFFVTKDPVQLQVWKNENSYLSLIHSQNVTPSDSNIAQTIATTGCVEVNKNCMLGFSSVDGAPAPIAYQFFSSERWSVHFRQAFSNGRFNTFYYPYQFALGGVVDTTLQCEDDKK